MWPAIEGKTAVTVEELEQAKQPPEHLTLIVGLREQAPPFFGSRILGLPMRLAFAIACVLAVGCTDAAKGAPRAPGDASPGDAANRVRGDSGPREDSRAPAILDGSAIVQRDVPGFPGRPYLVHLPSAARPSSPAAVVLVLHGGGGTAESNRRLTCPSGILVSPRCLEGVADRKGFVVVYPNGTPDVGAAAGRTWNAGGGTLGFQCVSGTACRDHVDDVAYFRALLADLPAVSPVDEKRVFATGISNGAAMTHRLACELSDRIAAIAPVSGGNQFSTGAPCAPPRAVSDLEIHGTEDPCWAYDGGPAACAQKDGLNKIDVPKTVADWVARNGCPSAPDLSDLPDTDPNDGTRTHAERYASCRDGTEVRLLRIEGGGHTWPGGFQYLPVASVGRIAKDFDANAVMWDFFAAHPMP
jgi:polyhydroxybutyrate depolymerase